MSASAPMLVIFTALLFAGSVLIVFSRRGDPDTPRAAFFGSGLALILASCAGLASVMAVQHLSARAARHAEVESIRAEEDAREAITTLIEQGNRLAAEAAAERDRRAAPLPEGEADATPHEPAATGDD